jgi:cbb3-type cytochrome oxidase subunit 3
MKTYFQEWLTDTWFVLALVIFSLAIIGFYAWQRIRRPEEYKNKK